MVSPLFLVETGAEARAERLIVEFEEANFVRVKRGTFLVDVDSFNYSVNRKSKLNYIGIVLSVNPGFVDDEL